MLTIKGYRPQGIRQWGDLQKVELLVYMNIESQQPEVLYALQMMMMMMKMMMTTTTTMTVTILRFTQIFGMDQPKIWAAVQGWTLVKDQTVMDVLANPIVYMWSECQCHV